MHAARTQRYTESKRRDPVPWSAGDVVMAARKIKIDKRWGKSRRPLLARRVNERCARIRQRKERWSRTQQQQQPSQQVKQEAGMACLP